MQKSTHQRKAWWVLFFLIVGQIRVLIIVAVLCVILVVLADAVILVISMSTDLWAFLHIIVSIIARIVLADICLPSTVTVTRCSKRTSNARSSCSSAAVFYPSRFEFYCQCDLPAVRKIAMFHCTACRIAGNDFHSLAVGVVASDQGCAIPIQPFQCDLVKAVAACEAAGVIGVDYL